MNKTLTCGSEGLALLSRDLDHLLEGHLTRVGNIKIHDLIRLVDNVNIHVNMV
jgi:hypothetical protein